MPPERHQDCDHVVIVADEDSSRRDGVRLELERVAGHERGPASGRRRRFRVLAAADADEALRLASREVSACACAASLAWRDGGRLVEELRSRRPDAAIVVFGPGASAPGSNPALHAADRVIDAASAPEVARAVEAGLALRRLAVLVARSEAELTEARQRLARLGGTLPPGGASALRPPATRDAVVPFQQAARDYLAGAAALFATDPRGLAERLGISYFAMRRLLKRYGVPIPGRPRRNHPAHPPTSAPKR